MTDFKSTRQTFFYRGNAVAYGLNFIDANLSASIPVTGGEVNNERESQHTGPMKVESAKVKIHGRPLKTEDGPARRTDVQAKLQHLSLQFGKEDHDVFQINKLSSSIYSEHKHRRRHPMFLGIHPEHLHLHMRIGKADIRVQFDDELCRFETVDAMETRFKEDDNWRACHQKRFIGTPPEGFRYWFTRPGIPRVGRQYYYHVVSKIHIEGDTGRDIKTEDNKIYVPGFGIITAGGVIRDRNMLRLSLVRFNLVPDALHFIWHDLHGHSHVQPKAADASENSEIAALQSAQFQASHATPPSGGGGTAGEVESNGGDVRDG